RLPRAGAPEPRRPRGQPQVRPGRRRRPVRQGEQPPGGWSGVDTAVEHSAVRRGREDREGGCGSGRADQNCGRGGEGRAEAPVRMKRRDARAFWLFVGPFLLGLAIFAYLPIGWSAYPSFFDARNTVT